MAPVLRALSHTKGVESIVCITGQHRFMLEQVLNLFDITADHDLDVMVEGQTLNGLSARILERLDPVLDHVRPQRVLVHGDTSTAMAAALAAFHRKIPVGHVEAGLRTGSLAEPWPEEFNRRMVDVVSDYLFAPTEQARDNLLAERLSGQIHVTGNTVIDALQVVADQLDQHPALREQIDGRLPRLAPDARMVLVTSHRRENFGEGFDQICGALRKAHSLGIIHRDLKPENCFRVVGGEDPDFIKVLDFGIAKIVAPEFSDDVQLTGTGDLLGTTPYMAPEQVRGQRVDHRIDIYALGVILFQALTGQLPFDGANRAQVLAAILLNDTPTMHSVDPYARVPPQLEQLVATALHKDPAKRFQTMDSLADAIRALPADLPLAPMPEGPPRPLPGVIATRGWTDIVGADPLANRGHTEIADVMRSDGPALGSPGPAHRAESATPPPAASRSRDDILLTEDGVGPRRRLRGPAAAVLGALVVVTGGVWVMLPDPTPPQAAITVPQPTQVIVAPPVLPDPASAPPPPAIEEPTDEDPPSSTHVVLTSRDVELRVERWRKSVEAQPPRPCQFGLTREFRLEAEVRDATLALRSGASLPADHERCREELERSLRRRFPSSRAIKGGVARVEKIRLLLR